MSKNIENVLRRIIYENGIKIINDLEKLEQYLKSACPQSIKEINAILLGCIEKIPEEIINLNISSTDTQIKYSLIDRLMNNLPVEPFWAEWIVDIWIFALLKNPISREGIYDDDTLNHQKTSSVIKECFSLVDNKSSDEAEGPACFGYITAFDDSIYYSNSFNYGKPFKVKIAKEEDLPPSKNYYIYYPCNWNYSIRCVDSSILCTRFWQ